MYSIMHLFKFATTISVIYGYLEVTMNRCPNRVFLLLSVMGVATGLFLLLPFLNILEILLIALGILCLVWGVSEVDDRIHLHRARQQRREMNLQRFRRLPPHRGRY